jgi:hypothetical protein
MVDKLEFNCQLQFKTTNGPFEVHIFPFPDKSLPNIENQ